MVKKSTLKLIIIFFLTILGYFNSEMIIGAVQDHNYLNLNELKISQNNNNFEKIELFLNKIEILDKKPEVIFCPSDDCFNFLINNFENAKKEIICAFYELDNFNLTSKLFEKSNQGLNVELIIDNKYLEEKSLRIFSNSSIKIYSDINRGTRYNNYMHSKFCVIDNEYILTGSTNPTENGIFKNNNNLVGFKSNFLAQNYKNEFLQMASNKYGTNKISTLKYNNITLKYNNNTYLVNSYMCPQDNCMSKLIEKINSAKEEILFATFAITYDDLKEELIDKVNHDIKIKGIIEKRNKNLKGSDFYELNKSKIEMFTDKNKNNMHHKFFIIDKKIVITGSMNPSASGAKYNDENILIIENKEIAKLFKEEFEKLIN